MAAVTLSDDWIHSVLSLAISLTPRGRVIINDSDVPAYRFQAATSKPSWLIKCFWSRFNFLTLPSSLLRPSFLVAWKSLLRNTCCDYDMSIEKNMSQSWTDTQTGAKGVSVSPRWLDGRSPIVCCRVKVSAPTKSPSVALSGRQIRIQHPSI